MGSSTTSAIASVSMRGPLLEYSRGCTQGPPKMGVTNSHPPSVGCLKAPFVLRMCAKSQCVCETIRASMAAPSEPSRLNKRMAELGLCSRREADDWIAQGWVKVNGRVAEMGVKVTPDDRIEVDRKAQNQQQQQVTILLHKPMGYVSGQAEDGHEPAVVLINPPTPW